MGHAAQLAGLLAGLAMMGFAHLQSPPEDPSPTAVIVVGAPRTSLVAGPIDGALDINVKPKRTEVWVDGRYRGIADEFDGFPSKLFLRGGVHELRLVTPEGLVVRGTIEVVEGAEIDVSLDLRT